MHGRETLMCLVDKEALILEKPPVESVKEQFILIQQERECVCEQYKKYNFTDEVQNGWNTLFGSQNSKKLYECLR